MHDSFPICAFSGKQQKELMSPELKKALVNTPLSDSMEVAASFGRWWLDRQTFEVVLSAGAAGYLDVDVGWHPAAEECFANVIPDDVLVLMSILEQARDHGGPIDCEFRVINARNGLRWLRVSSLPEALPLDVVQTGVVVDITATKHAEMRERFSFESTQYLVGAHTLGESVTRVIQLVCENLGWEWGAYWSLDPDQAGKHVFACRHYWHQPGSALALFAQESCATRIAAGEGLIGQVWSSGQAQWAEEMAKNKGFKCQKSATACGLRSGYVFPVSYVDANGQHHSPGVLEFFSCLPRQPEAQLPNLSAAIGSLIAQTVQRHEQQAYILQLAQIDELTGLVNRSHFHERLDEACDSAMQIGATFGVMFIDLDHFKPINDVFSHEAGNQVLREFAQRLEQIMQGECTVGRLGGDEFAVLSNFGKSREQLGELAEQVLLAARTPFMFEGNECVVSASIGISIFPEHGCDGPRLLRNADSAMYHSKKTGRNALSIFSKDAGAQSRLTQHLTMEIELHRALRDSEFFLEYQPVFDSLHERMVAIEALIRWRRPNGEIVRPDVFIPLAAKSRLIVQIGRWVVAQACSDLSCLHRAGLTDLQVNVNLTMPDFTNSNLPEELAAIVTDYGLAARHLCLEVTEDLVMKYPVKVISVMRALRKRGFGISLDDFGMGHSSLSWLKQLPITSLKIDRSFVSGLPSDTGDGAIVRTILDLGRHMKLKVIAEGIENDAQLLFLRQFGCHLVQGFLLGRPVGMTELVSAQLPARALALI